VTDEWVNDPLEPMPTSIRRIKVRIIHDVSDLREWEKPLMAYHIFHWTRIPLGGIGDYHGSCGDLQTAMDKCHNELSLDPHYQHGKWVEILVEAKHGLILVAEWPWDTEEGLDWHITPEGKKLRGIK
jgi:hypothetical protein